MASNTPANDASQAPHNNGLDISPVEPAERIMVQPKGSGISPVASIGNGTTPAHGPVEFASQGDGGERTAQQFIDEKSKGRFSYLRTRQFWIVLLLSQALAVATTGTNTITTLLVNVNTNIPAFQTLFNYILLNLIYTTYTIYRYGFKGWLRLLVTDGWKYLILAFCDVEGNYFTVLAYRYTNILSAQLINFWAIAVVVAISLIFLKVRYHIAQYLGILVCIGGVGLLIASDHITGAASNETADAVKGDLFALLGATFYGLSNVFEEFLVSKRPMWEVLGQLAFFAFFINGTQAAIFDRGQFDGATCDGQVVGYFIGYTLILTFFYSGAPIVFRMASAAFFNIGLLTGSFWGVAIGTQVFGYTIHWLYPVAFVLIIGGHFVYYGTEGVLGEARKPWLGENQDEGVAGVGTARRRLENPEAAV